MSCSTLNTRRRRGFISCSGCPFGNIRNNGVWVSSNTHADVSGVVVSGISPGIDTIIYTVTVAGCSNSATQVVNVKSCPSGVAPPLHSPKERETLHVYPSPNAGTFTINVLSDVDKEARVVITNMVGERVKEFTATTNKNVDVTLDVAAGVYFLNAVTRSGVWSGKVVVERR